MTPIGPRERATQDRIVKLFQEKLGYRYLGNWEQRAGNRNLEEDLLRAYLGQHYTENLIAKALYELDKVANDQSKSSLYDLNKAVYSLLRYGVNVQPEIGQHKQTVWLIDWAHPEQNDFAIAEEVTITGTHTKRPDLVLYVNGIALGIIELKRSTVSLTEGIRQNLDNQKDVFIKPFFTTIQFIMAGTDHEGLAYGAIDTKEKYYLKWKEVSERENPADTYLLQMTKPIRELAETVEHRLDRHVIQMLNKERFLEMVHDFVVFDRGIKKLPRPNQYFGIKAAQDHVRRREGGIIWHTQGSGKSLTMVWLTKWIRENIEGARVLIITDRTELDEQIEKVFKGVDEQIYRTRSGQDLVRQLNSHAPWLLCSLVHKFGGKEEASAKDVAQYVQDLKASLPADFSPKGNLFVFVDECHRTQSGKLHESMTALLPHALFIGFTGTPLLKQDKATSLEVFGRYIHTYKFDEAVSDGVVLDLRYEARDVEQSINSHQGIDDWFEAKTKGLSDYARAELKARWGTLKKVFSAKSRLEKIVMDIMVDMSKKERLQNGRGNAMLVSDSVYNACRYYDLFQRAGLERCAIITSYAPNHGDIKGEESGEGKTEKLLKYEIYQRMIARYYNIREEEAAAKVSAFEEDVKKKFVEEPAQMKLLIVVDKLLTGFDAPPATYLYIDKRMRDHGLFQAICRVNRLDGDDKEYGYIIDYKDLFKMLGKSIKDYTSEAFDSYDKADVQGLLADRLQKARERLDDSLEAVKAMVEPVEPPKGQLEYLHYFVGDPESRTAIKETEPQRHAFYKAVSQLVRAYANLADDMEAAGYHETTAIRIKAEVEHFQRAKDEIMLAAGEQINLKQYEPGMRQLIDFYLDAKNSRVLSQFDDLGLVDLVVNQGEDFVQDLQRRTGKEPGAMAETIESNLRKVIIEESPTNPAYYDRMSMLLDEVIEQRKQQSLEYEAYLREIVQLARQIKKPATGTSYPDSLQTSAQVALYENLDQNEALAVVMDREIRYVLRDGWRDHKIKQRMVRLKIMDVLAAHGIADAEEVERIFDLVKNQKAY